MLVSHLEENCSLRRPYAPDAQDDRLRDYI